MGVFSSYIFIPAYREVKTPSNNTNVLLTQEAEATFSTFVNNADRICTTTDMAPRDYWLRSPAVSSSSYFYYVSSSGDVQEWGSYSDLKYIRPMLVV